MKLGVFFQLNVTRNAYVQIRVPMAIGPKHYHPWAGNLSTCRYIQNEMCFIRTSHYTLKGRRSMKRGKLEMPCFICTQFHGIQHFFVMSCTTEMHIPSYIHPAGGKMAIYSFRSRIWIGVNGQRHRFLGRSTGVKPRNLRNSRIILNSNWAGCRDAKGKESTWVARPNCQCLYCYFNYVYTY
jgi:hypothetical protein